MITPVLNCFSLFQALFVICSIPPALLGRINFKPPLPALKNQVWIAGGFSNNMGVWFVWVMIDRTDVLVFFSVFRGGMSLLQISGFPSTILEHFHAVFTPSFSPLLRTRVGSLIWFCGEGLIQGGQFVRETNSLGVRVKTGGKHVITGMCFPSI